MAKVRCKGCKEYDYKDAMLVHLGVSYYHSWDCVNASKNQKPNTGKKKNKSKSPSKPKKEDYSSISESVRNEVLALDNYRCRYCGGTSNLAAHHVRYKSEARWFPWCSQPENVITLCNQPCHLTVIHGNKDKYQPLCLQIIEMRKQGDRTTLIKDME